MLYHCGLLDEHPERSVTLQWIRRGGWDLEGFPPDVRRELMIWLAMPGFSDAFHRKTLLIGQNYWKRYSDYSSWKREVADNWLSATREDCIKLALMRPREGKVPLISQLRALQDLKEGLGYAQVSKDYKVTQACLGKWVRGHIDAELLLPFKV